MSLYHHNFCLGNISNYFLNSCGITAINLQRYRGYTNTASATYRNSLPDEVRTLFHLQSATSGERARQTFAPDSRSGAGSGGLRVADLQSGMGSVRSRRYYPAYSIRKAPRFAFTAHDEEETGRCCRRCPSRRRSRRHRRRCRHRRHCRRRRPRRRAILSWTVEQSWLPAHAENSH